jgi:hypothetical protein
MVRQRHVFHLAGYDPIGAALYRVFKRELLTFARTWNVCSAVSDFTPQSEASHAQWKVTTRAPNWQVETIYELLLWDDIVLTDFAQPVTKRLATHANVRDVRKGHGTGHPMCNHGGDWPGRQWRRSEGLAEFASHHLRVRSRPGS